MWNPPIPIKYYDRADDLPGFIVVNDYKENYLKAGDIVSYNISGEDTEIAVVYSIDTDNMKCLVRTIDGIVRKFTFRLGIALNPGHLNAYRISANNASFTGVETAYIGISQSFNLIGTGSFKPELYLRNADICLSNVIHIKSENREIIASIDPVEKTITLDKSWKFKFKNEEAYTEVISIGKIEDSKSIDIE